MLNDIAVYNIKLVYFFKDLKFKGWEGGRRHFPNKRSLSPQLAKH